MRSRRARTLCPNKDREDINRQITKVFMHNCLLFIPQPRDQYFSLCIPLFWVSPADPNHVVSSPFQSSTPVGCLQPKFKDLGACFDLMEVGADQVESQDPQRESAEGARWNLQGVRPQVQRSVTIGTGFLMGMLSIRYTSRARDTPAELRAATRSSWPDVYTLTCPKGLNTYARGIYLLLRTITPAHPGQLPYCSNPNSH